LSKIHLLLPKWIEMSAFDQQLINLVAAQSALLNQIITSSKTNDELPVQLPLIPSSKIRVYANSESKTVTISEIIAQAVSVIQPNSNRFIETNGFSLDDQDLTINSGWTWTINGGSYTNPSDVTINIPFAASGKSRIDFITATIGGSFIRIAGVESTGTPVAPTLPVNQLLATFVTVTDASVGSPPTVSTPMYYGIFGSESELTTVRDDVAYGAFAWILNTGVLELALYDGSDWQYFNLLGGSSTPATFLSLQIKRKGTGNTAPTLESGDWVEGGVSEGSGTSIWWSLAKYNGGDPATLSNYTVISSITDF